MRLLARQPRLGLAAPPAMLAAGGAARRGWASTASPTVAAGRALRWSRQPLRWQQQQCQQQRRAFATALSPVDIIAKKRDGEELTPDEIHDFVQRFTAGEVADYQMSAWLMAVCLQGMTAQETAELTLAMVQSGSVADLSGKPSDSRAILQLRAISTSSLSLSLSLSLSDISLCVCRHPGAQVRQAQHGRRRRQDLPHPRAPRRFLRRRRPDGTISTKLDLK